MNQNFNFPKALTDKYDVAPSLRPAMTEFPKSLGTYKIDLSKEDCVRLVDTLVNTYPDQKYFTLKSKKSSPAAGKE